MAQKARNLSIRVIRTSRQGPVELIKQIKTASKYIDQGLIDLANLVRNKMVEQIDIQRSRPKGNNSGWLAKHIEVIPYPGGVGIGDKRILNARAPYWRVLNDGGYVPLSTTDKGVLGFFGSGDKPDPSQRGVGKGSQNWTYTTGGFGPGIYYMKPTSPIKGRRYIEKAQHWLVVNAKTFWNNQLNRRNWAK